ncbi:DsbA family protein [Companilactobacillus tucceti]|nr:DsbA family protein [Companilactobacillus tucceti]
MWEVFLYINPLCSYCLKVEQAIIDFTRKHDIETQYHFVTTNNMETINEYMQLKGYQLCDLQNRSKVSTDIYEAASLYKAASCQGNKKARNFLMNLQEQINVLDNPFNAESVKVAINDSGLDYEAIMEDKQSECVEQGIQRDQQLAIEMNITKAPTVVVFDLNNEDRPGVMIDDFGSKTSEEVINSNLTAMLEAAIPEVAEQPTINSSTVISLDKFRR